MKDSKDKRYEMPGGFIHNAPHLAGELIEKFGPVAPIERHNPPTRKGGSEAKIGQLRSVIWGGKE